MQYLNKSQLAFLLDIKVEDARARMCAAWAKYKGIPEEHDKEGPRIGKTARDAKKKVKDEYPIVMGVDMLSKYAGLPDLQFAVNDITNNYLKRPGTRKFILSDYPDKELTKQHAAGKPYKLHIPSFISAFLSKADQDAIVEEWKRRYPQAFPVPTEEANTIQP